MSLLWLTLLLHALGTWTATGTSKASDVQQVLIPAQKLSSLSSSHFTHFSHPAFPRHGVRVKQTSFCDGTVKAYTGYIDVESRHLFFYFFESRNDPDNDNVIFWTNGGPGGSSSVGLFMELGPCKILDNNGTQFNPFSWNSNTNIFFVDQPIGVGFSYADYGQAVDTTTAAAKDIAAFTAIFFEHFSQYRSRPFHMAGESYGGHYIPVFAAEVYDQNKKLVEEGMTPINLKSIMIGNGVTDVYPWFTAYYDMACTNASLPPILDIQTCTRMKQIIPRCQNRLKEVCINQFDKINCQAAARFCESGLREPIMNSGINPYDISRPCDGEVSDALCYPVTRHIAKYLNRPEVRSLLGIDASFGNFSLVSMDVNAAFAQSMDEFHPSQHYVSALLERGVKALIYVGTFDSLCNYIENERWTRRLDWTGHEEFATKPLREWFVDPGGKAGVTRNARGLTYLTIDGAGHMVPYDKPKIALEMLNRWLEGKEF
ncbi:serine carboxypeptidase [Agrocybe pediades]|nr:serine carboxypeptidase [Agrocybe pediades]